MSKELVFLFDVDNTLLDNDRVTADLKCHLERGRSGTPAALLDDLRAVARPSGIR